MIRLFGVFFLLFFISCGQKEQKEDDLLESNEIVESSPYGKHKLFWNYESEFSTQEKKKLRSWIIQVVEATTRTIGDYPFDLHFYFRRSESNRPVSFGHTIRGPEQAVRFYVNPSFSLDDLLADWTAPHEISHLSQPFVGKKNKWFSEGYATYMSRQIMIEMGYYTDAEFDSLYLTKIGATKKYYGSQTSTHIEVSDSLVRNHSYGDMYWGCSSFFFTVDLQLQEKHGKRFKDVVKDYQACCRLEDKALKSIIFSYDKLIEDTLFTSLMKRYRNDPSYKVMEDF
jgi:hypothetical protein